MTPDRERDAIVQIAVSGQAEIDNSPENAHVQRVAAFRPEASFASW